MRNAPTPLCFDHLRHGQNCDRPINRLPAGHGDRIVEQHLVGDVAFRRDRLTDRQRPRMIKRPLTKVLKDMFAAIIGAARDPIDAFAAHLDQG